MGSRPSKAPVACCGGRALAHMATLLLLLWTLFLQSRRLSIQSLAVLLVAVVAVAMPPWCKQRCCRACHVCTAAASPRLCIMTAATACTVLLPRPQRLPEVQRRCDRTALGGRRRSHWRARRLRQRCCACGTPRQRCCACGSGCGLGHVSRRGPHPRHRGSSRRCGGRHLRARPWEEGGAAAVARAGSGVGHSAGSGDGVGSSSAAA